MKRAKRDRAREPSCGKKKKVKKIGERIAGTRWSEGAPQHVPEPSEAMEIKKKNEAERERERKSWGIENQNKIEATATK